jgi:Zn-dependent protease/CBS domain-containing protein
MRWSWRIGSLAGISIYVHATFLLLILFILFINWHQGKTLTTAVWGVIFVVVIFGCIVLHELGHALAARKYGIKTRDITLLPIGGLARLERMPDVPIQELWVALAGPAVNAVIAGALLLGEVLMGVHPDLAQFRWFGGNFLNKLMVVNFWLVAFNLIPAFPMDGGRVLRALLARRMEYTRATVAAARVGQMIAYVFGFLGLFLDPFLLFIALFVWMGAEQESAMVQIHTSLGGIPVQRAMLTEFRTLNPDDTLDTAVNHILAGWQQDFPVVWGERVMGILTREDLMKALAQGGTKAPVRDAMNREFETTDSHEMLEKALARLRDCRCRSLPVVHDGQLVGMLTTDNVGEFLMIQSALRQARYAKSAAQGQVTTRNSGDQGPRYFG